MSQKMPIVLVSASIFALAVGCGSDPVATPNTATNAQDAQKMAVQAAPKVVATNAAPKKDRNTPTAGSVHIEDRILRACGDIPTARFAFDSTDIEVEATKALAALAKCFTTGPLAGKGMKLVGHADSRGETEYNFGLGQKRAGSVAEFLGKRGLGKGRLETSSHGELEATGIDDEGWSMDRKVDVFLAE